MAYNSCSAVWAWKIHRLATEHLVSVLGMMISLIIRQLFYSGKTLVRRLFHENKVSASRRLFQSTEGLCSTRFYGRVIPIYSLYKPCSRYPRNFLSIQAFGEGGCRLGLFRKFCQVTGQPMCPSVWRDEDFLEVNYHDFFLVSAQATLPLVITCITVQTQKFQPVVNCLQLLSAK